MKKHVTVLFAGLLALAGCGVKKDSPKALKPKIKKITAVKKIEKPKAPTKKLAEAKPQVKKVEPPSVQTVAAAEAKKKDASLRELIEIKNTALKSERYDTAAQQLEKIVSEHADHSKIGDFKIELADVHMKINQHESAYKLYRNFAKMFPSDSRVEECQHQAIMAKYYQTLKISSECDATDTQKTLKLCAKYLNNSDFKAHSKEVANIKLTCENRLVDKEVYVFSTYLRQKKFTSARKRIDYLRENYLKGNPTLEARILYLECKLAHYLDENDERSDILDTLSDKFPESQFTRMAEGLGNMKGIFNA
ncbi:outer membrane protein assembly factor BamD [bacterium]|nr:outer membrane protein assembly factor BamD [bacterium]